MAGLVRSRNKLRRKCSRLIIKLHEIDMGEPAGTVSFD